MKATILTEFGDREVFKVKNISQPAPGPGEVLVKVIATSVNLIDCRHRKYGSFYGLKLPSVIGCEVSGVIEASGGTKGQFNAGDEVFYSTTIAHKQGTYAEYHVAKESTLVRKPAALSHYAAVGLPVNASLLWEALIVTGGLTKDETLLIRDGIDCLGMIAIQVAKVAGAKVIVLCDKIQMDIAKSLGADFILDRKDQNVHQNIDRVTRKKGVDIFLDTIGGADVSDFVAHMKPGGRMVGLVDMQIFPSEVAEKSISTHLVRHQSHHNKLEILLDLIEQGQIKSVVDTVMPLSDAGAAHQRMERGITCGKIVLVPN